MHRFGEKVVLITGGTSGMGLATAQRFLEEGAYVVVTGRSQEKLDSVAHQFNESNRLFPLQADVTDLKAIDTTMERIKEKFGHVDIVFANAGLGNFKHVVDFNEQDFDHLVNVNFKGVFFTVEEVRALSMLEPKLRCIILLVHSLLILPHAVFVSIL